MAYRCREYYVRYNQLKLLTCGLLFQYFETQIILLHIRWNGDGSYQNCRSKAPEPLLVSPLPHLLYHCLEQHKMPRISPRFLGPLAVTRAPDPCRGHAPLGLTVEYATNTSGSVRPRRKANRLGRTGFLADVQPVSWTTQEGTRALGIIRNVAYIR